MKAYSIAKFEERVTNEDAAIAKKNMIAVSDGAGGGGVFADKWSRYLVENLPDKPIADYQAFDAWIDSIWEPFYNKYEEIAKKVGGMILNKFYDEGSFATLVAVWSTGQWISYGDSVAFCYDKETGKLQYSFGRIDNFNNPPYLINCKDQTNEYGFKCGQFNINKECIVFAASDALAHYILMMYEIAHKDWYGEELLDAIDAHTKNSNLIKTAMSLKKKNYEKTLFKLLGLQHKGHFKQHLQKVYRDGLLGYDDYSLAIL